MINYRQYEPVTDSIDDYYAPSVSTKWERIIQSYAMAFSIDPDIVENYDIRKLLHFCAIENNKYSAMNFKRDHPKK